MRWGRVFFCLFSSFSFVFSLVRSTTLGTGLGGGQRGAYCEPPADLSRSGRTGHYGQEPDNMYMYRYDLFRSHATNGRTKQKAGGGGGGGGGI